MSQNKEKGKQKYNIKNQTLNILQTESGLKHKEFVKLKLTGKLVVIIFWPKVQKQNRLCYKQTNWVS